ncbi:DAK2 domain-containing protein [Ornithinimicrobium sp. INDO-MA30-4]|uniref:DAK2 domain-containing protein n=1 Tax=Ornithinimicrobium sp. INDO-MA30-4 TaxID=2908651 RepID=UPI001F2F262C|nr:DAK2 domain-containing protein [Ornithinimicrobium sp. INDO-MA30-4]UJH70794.1 DAK2 domain-containing protein [Ornithinimicrobium sp. INDO-MA30-4]
MSETQLDLAAAHRWALSAHALLDEACARINELNVFPVPDADTGTNLFLTFDGALQYVRSHDSLMSEPLTLAQGLELLARGMLLSARGNSG